MKVTYTYVHILVNILMSEYVCLIRQHISIIKTYIWLLKGKLVLSYTHTYVDIPKSFFFREFTSVYQKYHVIN